MKTSADRRKSRSKALPDLQTPRGRERGTSAEKCGPAPKREKRRFRRAGASNRKGKTGIDEGQLYRGKTAILGKG